MLLLKPLFTANRVTVFGDHVDPDQFYYLPENPRISTDADGKPAFTLIKYMRDITDNPAFAEGQQLGGGFLMFTADLSMDDATRTSILRQARMFGSSNPRLATAPFREGDVKIIALDAADAPVDGQPRFIESVIGSAKPSLFGDLRATFSLKLSQEGVVMLEDAYKQGGKPIGLSYDLKFLGLRPAFDVTIHADYKRIYNDFSAKLAAQYLMLRAEIEAEFQKLQEQKAIQVTVNSFTDDANSRQQLHDALGFLKDQLLKDFFTSSLPLPRDGTDNILAGLTNSLNLPQTAGRTLTQANSGAALTPGPASSVTQPAGAPPIQPPAQGSPTDGSHPAAVRTATPNNPAASAPAAAPAPTGQPQAAAPAGGGSGGNILSQMSVGFKLRFLHQEELKTFDMSWKEADAVEQAHTPNGTFGLMLLGLNRAQHFIDVNLDDDFFSRIKVMVDSPAPFGPIGLTEIKAHLEYGDRGDGQPRFVNDLELKPDDKGKIAPQEFTCSLDPFRTLSYRYSLDFFFDPNSDTRGQKMHYTAGPFTTFDRTLSIDPDTYVSHIRLDISTAVIDFDRIPRMQVKLGYDDDPNNFHVQDTFVLTKDKPASKWVVRLTNPDKKDYWYEITYFLKDGQTLAQPRQTSNSRSLVINEPWNDRLQLLLDGAFASDIAKLIVELQYEDASAGYRFSSIQPLLKGSTAPVAVTIPILNADRRAYQYRVTAVGTNNIPRRGALVSTEDTFLEVTAPA